MPTVSAASVAARQEGTEGLPESVQARSVSSSALPRMGRAR